MSTSNVIHLHPDSYRARLSEARVVDEIRRDLLERGVPAAQVQHVCARARASLRRGRPPRGPLQGVIHRAKDQGLSPFSLMDGLQATLRALMEGRSGAVAYQAGIAAMRSRTAGAEPKGAA